MANKIAIRFQKNEQTSPIYMLNFSLDYGHMDQKRKILNDLKKWSRNPETIIYSISYGGIKKEDVLYIWCLNLICESEKKIDIVNYYDEFLMTLLIIQKDCYHFSDSTDRLEIQYLPFAFDQKKFININKFGINPILYVEKSSVSLEKIEINIKNFLNLFIKKTFEEQELYNQFYFSNLTYREDVLSGKSKNTDIFIQLFKFVLKRNKIDNLLSEWKNFAQENKLKVKRILKNQYAVIFLGLIFKKLKEESEYKTYQIISTEMMNKVFEEVNESEKIEDSAIDMIYWIDQLISQENAHLKNNEDYWENRYFGKIKDLKKRSIFKKMLFEQLKEKALLNKNPNDIFDSKKINLEKKYFSNYLEMEIMSLKNPFVGRLMSWTQTTDSSNQEKLEILETNYSVEEISIYLIELIDIVTSRQNCFATKAQLFYLIKNIDGTILESCIKWINNVESLETFKGLIKTNFVVEKSGPRAENLFKKKHLLKMYFDDFRKTNFINKNIEAIYNRFTTRLQNMLFKYEEYYIKYELLNIDQLFELKNGEKIGIFFISMIDFSSLEKLFKIYGYLNEQFKFKNVEISLVKALEIKNIEEQKGIDCESQFVQNDINIKKINALLNKNVGPNLALLSYPWIIKKEKIYNQYFEINEMLDKSKDINLTFHFLYLLKNVAFWHWVNWRDSTCFLEKQLFLDTIKKYIKKIVNIENIDDLKPTAKDNALLINLNKCENDKDINAFIFLIISLFTLGDKSKNERLKESLKVEEIKIIDSPILKNLKPSDLFLLYERFLFSLIKKAHIGSEKDNAIYEENKDFAINLWKLMIQKCTLTTKYDIKKEYGDLYKINEDDWKNYEKYIYYLNNSSGNIRNFEEEFYSVNRYERVGGKIELTILWFINELIFEKRKNFTFKGSVEQKKKIWKFLTEHDRKFGLFDEDWKIFLLLIKEKNLFELSKNLEFSEN